MHPAWRPISRDEFDSLVDEQAAALDPRQKEMFDDSRVEPWQAIIRRSWEAGNEKVWVIAERDGEALYFDDVEWGWNWSGVSEEGRILRPGGSQNELGGLFL